MVRNRNIHSFFWTARVCDVAPLFLALLVKPESTEGEIPYKSAMEKGVCFWDEYQTCFHTFSSKNSVDNYLTIHFKAPKKVILTLILKIHPKKKGAFMAKPDEG